MQKMRKCKYILKNGNQCRATPQKNSDFCYFHNPSTNNEHFLSSKKGGSTKKKRIINSLEFIRLEESKDVVTLLTKTIQELRGEKIDVRVANAIGHLSNILLKAYELTSINSKVDELKSVLNLRR